MLREGINDVNLFKAVFLAGGPGSGKSFINEIFIGQDDINLSPLGVKVLNSDSFFEKKLTDLNLSFIIDKDSDEYEKQMEAREAAKILAANQAFLYIDGMLPLIIDGTGKDFKKISKQASILEGIGYDVSMLFVNTSLETALARNAKRKRTVDPELVEDMWLEVQNNLGAFQDFFGSNNFYIVDNSNDFDDPQAQAEFEKKLFKKGMQVFNAPLENYLGRMIIKKLRDSGGKYLSDLELIYSEEEIRKFKI